MGEYVLYIRTLLSVVLALFCMPAFCETISGNVRQDDILNNKNSVVDSKTEKPVQGAKIYIPNYNFETVTDSDGRFELKADIQDKAILQIEKEGYRPFSLTVDKFINEKPLKLGIEKSNTADIFIDKGIYHLGDDIYSTTSANCSQFKVKPFGPFYSKTINLKKPDSSKQAVIVFGSIIGLDTKLAKELGQNAIVSVYSSPFEVIFNGQKIAELNLNGDNQQVVIPPSLIRPSNILTLKTGRNLFQFKYVDYDDMEFANLRIEYQDKLFAKN